MNYLNDTLITADLHLTDRKADEYRWKVFDDLLRIIKKRKVKYLLILGDLTEKKDVHSSILIDRILRQFQRLASSGVKHVYFLMGNHDYEEPTKPFFQFLDLIPNVTFIKHMTSFNIGKAHCLFLPHTRSPKDDWKEWKLNKFDYIFTHQCYEGAVARSGMELDGAKIKTKAIVISGDIHEPQRVQGVRYVGSPYPIVFGDEFDCRFIYLTKDKIKSIKRKTIRKITYRMTSPDQYNTVTGEPGDMVKVIFTLPKSEFGIWDTLKEQTKNFCKSKGIDLKGLELRAETVTNKKGKAGRKRLTSQTPKATYTAFCKQEKLSKEIVKAGTEFVKD